MQLHHTRPAPDAAATVVCYCFRHTVQSIHDEVRRTGDSTVVAAITEKIRAGECDCERLNPKRVCCLGDVRQVVKGAFAAAGQTTPTLASSPETDCCGPATS